MTFPYIPQYPMELEDINTSARMEKKKKGGIDPTLPTDPFNDPNLEDISHPEAKDKGHHEFKDKRTGEIIRYDEGRPGETGHEGHDHFHRYNPNKTGKSDQYLDSNGNPVAKNSEESHLYPPEKVWWE